jgi:O-antigen/teichoic acid export membrane protein
MIFSNFKKNVHEFFWIGIGQLAAVLGSFVGVRVLTKYLVPEEYGRLALGLTIATLINQTLLGPLSNGVTRFFSPSLEKGELFHFFKDSRSILFKSSAIIILLFIPLIFYLFIYQNDFLIIITSSILFAMFTGFNAIISGIQNAARQRSIVALHQGIDPWLKFLVPVFLMIFFTNSSNTSMIGYAIASIIVFISQLFFFNKLYIKYDNLNTTINYEIEIKPNYKKQIIDFSWPISVFGIFTFLQLISDRWALKYFSSIEVVGLYAVLYQIGYYPLILITNVVGQYLSPILYQKAGDNSDPERIKYVNNIIWRISLFSLGLTNIAVLISYYYHSKIFLFFVDSSYSSISYLLPWVILGSGLFATSQILTINFMVEMKTKLIMKLKIITALLSVFMNIIGAYFYSINGIVIASILFPVLYILWVVLILKKDIINKFFYFDLCKCIPK